MTHRGSFQPQTFCDSVSVHWSLLWVQPEATLQDSLESCPGPSLSVTYISFPSSPRLFVMSIS